jgi:NAD(P)-dependent dehydrogenase (short-subunit alcohol dehydrogenase family)
VPAGEADTGIELTGAVPALPIPMAALVTGGAQRIGRALALALARDGFAVAIHYHHSRNAAERLAARIRGDGGQAIAIDADLADETAPTALLPMTRS